MANNLTIVSGSCIKVTGTTDESGEITDKITFIKSVYWYKPTGAAHLAVLVDSDGGPIITMVGDSNGNTNPNSQQWDVNAAFYGIFCDDLDSGTLYIYTR